MHCSIHIIYKNINNLRKLNNYFQTSNVLIKNIYILMNISGCGNWALSSFEDKTLGADQIGYLADKNAVKT